MYVQVKDLPQCLQSALDAVGFHGKDIRVTPEAEYTVSAVSGAGRRAFTCAVNMTTGKQQTYMGSWGGANMFNPTNAVDLDDTPRPLPENCAIIQGMQGERTFAHIYIHPSNVQRYLPTPAEVTPEESKALDVICGIKGGYRAAEFERLNLGRYSKDNSLIQSLVSKGLIKITGVGIQATTAGRNARGK